MKNLIRGVHRVFGNVHLSKARGESPMTHASAKLDESELIGIEAEGAPLAKLLFAIVSQARADKCAAITFSFPPGPVNFEVTFWRECTGFDPTGEALDAMSIPRNLGKALLCHALWMINHQDPAFASVRGTALFNEPTYDPARWPDSAPKCRCWLRDPHDMTTLVIQILDQGE